MIRRARAVRYDGQASSGRNQPLRATVETSDGEEYEVFLKVSGMKEVDTEGLANEVLAACLAGDLNLPITEPFLVDFKPEWIESILSVSVRDILTRSSPVGFGSKAAGQQWKIWSAADRLDPARLLPALHVLAFDAFIDNSDRRPGNPNCLVKGDEFRIIDHELAFRLRQKIAPVPAPWRTGNLQWLTANDGHIFANHLRGKTLDFAPLRQAWSNLSDERIMDYLTAVPLEWMSARDAIGDALTHLQNVRGNLEDCMAELERVLT